MEPEREKQLPQIILAASAAGWIYLYISVAAIILIFFLGGLTYADEKPICDGDARINMQTLWQYKAGCWLWQTP